MTKEELKKLYKEKILVHNKQPYHFEKKEELSEKIQAYNPLCGDKFDLFFDLSEDEIEPIFFHGIGCAISKASTSILIQKIEGKSKTEVIAFIHKFLQAIKEDEAQDFDDEELTVFQEIKQLDARQDCMTLSWQALYDHLNHS